MRILVIAAALAAAAPAFAQEKTQEWTPAQMTGLLKEMGYTVNKEGPSGKDYSIAASAPAGGLPVTIYGVNCQEKGGKPACPAADLVTGFKLKDSADKEAAKAKIASPGVRAIASASSPTVRIEVTLDFAPGLSADEVKAKFAEFQKTADAAFNALKADGFLAN